MACNNINIIKLEDGKKVKVKSIGKNDKGDITINGKPLLKFRLMK